MSRDSFTVDQEEHASDPPSGVIRRFSARWIEGSVLAGIVILFVVQALLIIRSGSPFGHDEAVYALRARDFLRGDVSGWYWFGFRAPGLPLALAPVAAIRATEPYLRMVIVGFGALLVVSTWWLGRTMFGRRVGLIAAAGLAISSTMVDASVQVWPDVPGAAVGLFAIALYAWALARERLTVPVMLAVGALTGIATLIRFGAPIPLGVGLVGITLWRYEYALSVWKRVVGAALLAGLIPAGILLLPSATAWAQWTADVDAVAAFKSFALHRDANDLPWTAGFVDYWDLRGKLVGSATVGLLLGIGLVASILGAIQRQVGRVALLVVLAVGGLTAGALAFILHGEARYLSPAMPWVWIAAAAGIAYLSKDWSRLTAVVLGISILLVGLAQSLPQVLEKYDFNRSAYSVIQSASVAVNEASTDYTCSVITSYTPQVGWYSQCVVFPFDRLSIGLDAVGRPDGDGYLMLVSQGKRQPQGAVLEQYLDETTGLFLEFGDPDGGRRQYVVVHPIESGR